jgi:hypothetical protein
MHACTLPILRHAAWLLPACRFDTVYVDGKIRIAQDIRGDMLIVENDGPPRIFT